MPDAQTHAEDLALARACARGEAEAVSRLVEAYGPLLQRVAERVLGQRGPDRAVTAEDLVGEVLVILFEDGASLLKAYRGDSGLGAYLAVIARRTALDAFRRGLVRAAGRVPLEVAEGLGAPPAPEEADDGERARLAGALAALSERDRRILTLRYLEGRSFREISRILGIPAGTTATWILRARGRLRTLWERRTKNQTEANQPGLLARPLHGDPR